MTVLDYQRDCFKNYKTSIGLTEEYTYLAGNPINVLVPIETTLNRAMIVGAYPSAKFYTIIGISDTPMSDNDSPFSNESYFDGSRVRTIPSGQELNEVILKRIGIRREDCWITDLVKVFLFKEGHINRYKRLGKCNLDQNRSHFDDYAKDSFCWLEKEIEICNPQIIILLGIEVSKIFFKISNTIAKEYLNGSLKLKEINGIERKVICLPHPGILMKRTDTNPWPEKFEKEISVLAKSEIEKIKMTWC